MKPVEELLNTIAANHGIELPANAKLAATSRMQWRKHLDDEDDAQLAQQDGAPADDVLADAQGTAGLTDNQPILLADAGAEAGAGAGIGLGTIALGGLAVGGIALAAGGGGGGGGGDSAPPVVPDTTAPVFTSAATASIAENTATSTTVYDATADGDVGVSYSLSGTDSALFNINASTGAVTFIASPDFEAPGDDGANNIYDFTVTVTATDGSGNTADQAVALTVTDVVGDAGDAMIDLGADGKLIAPVKVEGNWYYYWDRSGDGSNANSGSLNGGLDYTTHDVLDGIFNQDINGTVGGAGNTTDIYRYATLNGVHLALPTANGGMAYPSGINAYQPGTAYTDAGATSNGTTGTYDELLAIWDAYNGTSTGTNIDGTPSGWQASSYWSATPSASGHADVTLDFGNVVDDNDIINGYVALQVL